MMEEKNVKIDPLPESKPEPEPEPSLEPQPKKRGRPSKPKKPRVEKHVMTDKRKQALLKARLAKAEKRKKRLEEQEKALKQSQGKETEAQLPVSKPEVPHQDAVLNRIGQLEQSISSLSTSMEQLMSVGAFSQSKQSHKFPLN